MDYNFLFISIFLAGVIYIVIRLYMKNTLERIRWVGGEYAANRRLKEVMFEQTPYAAVATDSYGKILMCNDRFTKKFGYKEGEVLGQNISIIIPHRFRDKHEFGMQHFRDTGESGLVNNDDGIELYGLHKSGAEFPVHLKLKLIDSTFKILGAYIRNITKDKAKEKYMIDKISLLEAGERCAEMASWQWNTITGEVIPSENFYRLFNIHKGDKVTSEMLMDLIYEDDRSETAITIVESRENKKDYKTKYRRLQIDGSLIWLEVRGCWVYNDDGDITDCTGTIQKIGNVGKS